MATTAKDIRSRIHVYKYLNLTVNGVNDLLLHLNVHS
jgi:hypothetical protein